MYNSKNNKTCKHCVCVHVRKNKQRHRYPIRENFTLSENRYLCEFEDTKELEAYCHEIDTIGKRKPGDKINKLIRVNEAELKKGEEICAAFKRQDEMCASCPDSKAPCKSFSCPICPSCKCVKPTDFPKVTQDENIRCDKGYELYCVPEKYFKGNVFSP